jgi:hypothetical protein
MIAELVFAIHQRLFLDEMEETTLFWAVLGVHVGIDVSGCSGQRI